MASLFETLAEMDEQDKAKVLVTAAAIHALLLTSLGRRCRRHRNRAIRFIIWGASVAYFPFISYVLSYLTTFLSSLHNDLIWPVLTSVVLIQFLKAKADMAALSMSAVTSPAAGDDDINSLKVRPSMESLISALWAAGLVIYIIYHNRNEYLNDRFMMVPVVLLWTLGGCRMVIKFVAYQRATSSFTFGRNVQLIAGYMEQLHQQEECSLAEGLLQARATAVPRLIVTGETEQNVEESPQGYRVKASALLHDDQDGQSSSSSSSSSLVTLDRVWSVSDRVLSPQLKDLFLSFALFKCLRRRFAGFKLPEAGSDWALRFVCQGMMLGRREGGGDHEIIERVFRVVAAELTFAADFYYSPLPVASLDTVSAAIHFFLSLLIFASLCILTLILLVTIGVYFFDQMYYLPIFTLVLATITTCTEISEMAAGVRSNWTKIRIIGHYIRCQQSCCVRRIFSCLLRCGKSPKLRKADEMGQIELLMKPISLSSFEHTSCWAPAHHLKLFFFPCINHYCKPVIKVAPAVKSAVFRSLKSSGGRLSYGTAAVHGRCQSNISWACNGGELTTTTDAILVWCIATSLFDIRCSSRRASASASAYSSSTVDDRKLVARRLSRYCTYLVAEAPQLLPDDSAWTKRRYAVVKKNIDAASWLMRRGVPDDAGMYYQHLINSFDRQPSSHSDKDSEVEVLNKGSRLGKQLVEEAERPRSEEGDAGGAATGAIGEDAVWELLAEFWSEMVLYLAPSDNVKGHIEALQHRGEFITLLWALLLHAGITSRPAHQVRPEP